MFKTYPLIPKLKTLTPLLLISAATHAAQNNIHRELYKGNFSKALAYAESCAESDPKSKRRCDLNDVDEKGRTPLILATEKGATDLAIYLIKKGVVNLDAQDNDGNTPLMYATRSLNRQLVKKLIKFGAKVDLSNNQNNTALMWSVKDKWVTSNDKAYKIFTLILNADINRNYSEFRNRFDFINHGNFEGNTALMWASRAGNECAMTQLIQSGAIVNKQSDHGRTALMWLAESEEGTLSGAQILIAAEASITQTSRSGRTAIDYAQSKNNQAMVQFLMNILHPEQAKAAAPNQGGTPEEPSSLVAPSMRQLQHSNPSQISYSLKSPEKEHHGFRSFLRQAIKEKRRESGYHSDSEIEPESDKD